MRFVFQVLRFVHHYHFTDEDIDYLKSLPTFAVIELQLRRTLNSPFLAEL